MVHLKDIPKKSLIWITDENKAIPLDEILCPANENWQAIGPRGFISKQEGNSSNDCPLYVIPTRKENVEKKEDIKQYDDSGDSLDELMVEQEPVAQNDKYIDFSKDNTSINYQNDFTTLNNLLTMDDKMDTSHPWSNIINYETRDPNEICQKYDQLLEDFRMELKNKINNNVTTGQEIPTNLTTNKYNFLNGGD